MPRTPTALESLTSRRGFLAAQLGPTWSAPFTGFSWKAFEAYVLLVNAWYSADKLNRLHIENALRAVLYTLQDSEMPAARMAIYGLGHETAMRDLWPVIAPEKAVADEV